MKTRAILFYVLMGLISLQVWMGCKNDASTIPSKSDTQIVFAAYMGYQLKTVHWGDIKLITMDSLMYKYADTVKNNEKEKRKFTYGIGRVSVKVDSVIAKTFNVPLLDTAGNQNIVYGDIFIDRKYIVHPVFNLDSSVKYLSQKYLRKDSIK
ncbi:MAG TPA: hypothetical protein PKV73_01385 [Agriterribacter sp.]|nr:hypothetical protein [Agriterribacter sp.]